MIVTLTPGNPGDTIFAIASGPGQGAITVMRLSGAKTQPILLEMAGSVPPARRASLRPLRDNSGAMLDQALVLWMPGPASYTGEDTAELHLHGGRAVSEAVSRALLDAGARPADAGEFTRRAFLAGRMDLLEAEAIADLAASETQSQRKLALAALQGDAGTLVRNWSDTLTRCLAYQEAMIDFPDDLSTETADQDISEDLRRVAADIDQHLGRAKAGSILRTGLVTAIVGPPNVGKSSLFNALAKRDLAMISALPGTTRDALEARVEMAGIAVTLIDTAGLRETDDLLEQEGIRRARARAADADLLIQVSDPSCPSPLLEDARDIWVDNKIDLSPARVGSIGISTRTGEGLDALVCLLADQVRNLTRTEGDPVLSQARHVAALRDTRAALTRALDARLPELRADDLRRALQAIGRLTGRVDTEAVLDVVFGAFCIGK